MNPSQRTTQLAVALTAVGFLLIVLGWNGAAGLDRVPGQMPYVVSGGLGGLGLVLTGLTLALVQELRRNTAAVATKLDEVAESLARGEPTGPTAVPDDGTTVVAGRSTFHRPECRVIEGRADLQRMSPDAASQRSLTACRICEPVGRAG